MQPHPLIRTQTLPSPRCHWSSAEQGIRAAVEIIASPHPRHAGAARGATARGWRGGRVLQGGPAKASVARRGGQSGAPRLARCGPGGDGRVAPRAAVRVTQSGARTPWHVAAPRNQSVCRPPPLRCARVHTPKAEARLQGCSRGGGSPARSAPRTGARQARCTPARRPGQTRTQRMLVRVPVSRGRRRQTRLAAVTSLDGVGAQSLFWTPHFFWEPPWTG